MHSSRKPVAVNLGPRLSLAQLSTQKQMDFMIADLARSGLRPEDVPAWQPYTAKQITHFVGSGTVERRGGYHIPMWDLNDGELRGRVRRDTNTKKYRYAQPDNSENHWYLTPCLNGDKPWREVAEDLEIELWFVEGEKKAERVRKALLKRNITHVRVIAITGVLCHRTAEFAAFKLGGRVVRFCMDSDCSATASTPAAEQVRTLLSDFEQRGAVVHFCPTPALPEKRNKPTGADDYLQSGENAEEEYIKYVQGCTVTTGTRPAHVDLNAAPVHNPILDLAYAGLPEKALYGRAGECATKLMTAPRTYAYLALLAHAAPLVRVGNTYARYIRNVLYVMLCGDVAEGKTVARSEAVAKLAPYLGKSLFNNRTPSSDRGLYELFCPVRKKPKNEKEEEQQRVEEEARRAEIAGRAQVYSDGSKAICLPSYCLSADESRTLMSKANIQDSTLLQVLNTLFDYNSAGYAVRGKVQQFPPMDMSLFGCLTIKDPSDFREVFSVGSSHGFYDRLLLAVPSAKECDGYIFMPPDDEQRAGMWPQKWQFSSPDMPADIWQISKDWVFRAPSTETSKRRHRIREIGLRVAYVLAAMNGDKAVSAKVWKCVEALLEWQEALRSVYVHAVGADKQTEFTNVVLDYFSTVPGHAGSWRDIAIDQHWYRKFGASILNSVKQGLERGGVLAYDKASKKHYLTHLETEDKTKGATA